VRGVKFTSEPPVTVRFSPKGLAIARSHPACAPLTGLGYSPGPPACASRERAILAPSRRRGVRHASSTSTRSQRDPAVPEARLRRTAPGVGGICAASSRRGPAGGRDRRARASRRPRRCRPAPVRPVRGPAGRAGAASAGAAASGHQPTVTSATRRRGLVATTMRRTGPARSRRRGEAVDRGEWPAAAAPAAREQPRITVPLAMMSRRSASPVLIPPH